MSNKHPPATWLNWNPANVRHRPLHAVAPRTAQQPQLPVKASGTVIGSTSVTSMERSGCPHATYCPSLMPVDCGWTTIEVRLPPQFEGAEVESRGGSKQRWSLSTVAASPSHARAFCPSCCRPWPSSNDSTSTMFAMPSSPMLSNESGSTTAPLTPVHSKKARDPIAVSEVAPLKSMLVICVFPSHASAAISATPGPMVRIPTTALQSAAPNSLPCARSNPTLASTQANHSEHPGDVIPRRGLRWVKEPRSKWHRRRSLRKGYVLTYYKKLIT